MCCVHTYLKYALLVLVEYWKYLDKYSIYIFLQNMQLQLSFSFLFGWIWRILYFAFIGRMGERTGKADNKIRKGNADEKETRRPKCFDITTPTRTGWFREKHDA